jgi:hypothetical protein
MYGSVLIGLLATKRPLKPLNAILLGPPIQQAFQALEEGGPYTLLLRVGEHCDGGSLPELRVLTAPVVQIHIQNSIIIKPKIAPSEATNITIPTHSSKHQNCHREYHQMGVSLM